MKFRRRKNHDLLGVIHLYREQTGEPAIEMRKVAEFALSQLKWRMAPPLSAAERLAKDLSRAARTETRHDSVTKQPYRVNHAYPGDRAGEPTTLWIDIDEAPRVPMQLSLQLRRNQMLDDGFQLSLDADHWNRINPKEEPIGLVFDLTEDISERKSVPLGGQDRTG